MTRASMKRLLAVTVGMGTLASSVSGHHSHFYDECKPMTIEGRVERVEFKNPHNLIVLRLDDGSSYIVDWISVTRLTSAGIIDAAKAAIVSGARIAVTGYRIRDVADLRKTVRKFKGDVNPNTVEARQLRRVDDGFTWGAMPTAAFATCDQR